jgi:AcrR family transcriptional regulator
MPGDPTPRLSRELILAAAAQIAHEEGIGALSMRRLARALDVWPMSVYRYFSDKDALLDALAAEAAGDVELPVESADWRVRLRALLEESRSAIADPVGGRMGRAFLTPEGLRLSEAGLAILADAGIEGDEAASAWRALWSYTFGFATFTLAGPTAAAIDRLPPDEYPALAAAGPRLAAALADEGEFARGLELLLDGLEARAALRG